MSEHIPNDSRSRDDRDLHRLVADTRAWMKEQGIEEQEPDWQTIARQERARWWRRRLRYSLTTLANKEHGLPEAAASLLRRLAENREPLAEAAVEVTLKSVSGVGCVLFEPAKLCVSSEVRFARPARVEDESVGIVGTPHRLEATVLTEETAVAVEVPGEGVPPVLVLVPENPALPARVIQAEPSGGVMRARFTSLVPGAYLLSVHSTSSGTGRDIPEPCNTGAHEESLPVRMKQRDEAAFR